MCRKGGSVSSGFFAVLASGRSAISVIVGTLQFPVCMSYVYPMYPGCTVRRIHAVQLWFTFLFSAHLSHFVLIWNSFLTHTRVHTHCVDIGECTVHNVISAESNPAGLEQ